MGSTIPSAGILNCVRVEKWSWESKWACTLSKGNETGEMHRRLTGTLVYCIWLSVSVAGGDFLTNTAWSTGEQEQMSGWVHHPSRSHCQLTKPAAAFSENFLLYIMRRVSAIQRELRLRKFNCSSKETAFLTSKKFWKILSFFTHPKKFPTFI